METETVIGPSQPHGCGLDKAGERGEHVADLPGILETVAVALPVGVIARDLGQAQWTEHGAHALHAPADRAGNLAWGQFLVLCKRYSPAPACNLAVGEFDAVGEDAQHEF